MNHGPVTKFVRNPLYDKMREHIGHNVVMVYYGDKENPVDISVECEDCNCIIVDAEEMVEIADE